MTVNSSGVTMGGGGKRVGEGTARVTLSGGDTLMKVNIFAAEI